MTFKLDIKIVENSKMVLAEIKKAFAKKITVADSMISGMCIKLAFSTMQCAIPTEANAIIIHFSEHSGRLNTSLNIPMKIYVAL